MRAPSPESADNANINERIMHREVRLIDEHGQNVGVVETKQALVRAQEAGLDLVVIADGSTPAVCKILDYGKYRYEERKRKNLVRKNQKVVQTKEVKLRPVIDEHDFQVKLKKVRQFIDEGHRVRVTLRFRGREMSRQDIGLAILHRVRDELKDIAKVDQSPNMEGRQMVMQLVAGT